MIIILLIIIIILIFFNKNTFNNYESFNTTNTIKQIDGLSWFNDPMFETMSYFENDQDGFTGWKKCKIVCNGNCVEYGITGNSYCFERNVLDDQKKNYTGTFKKTLN